MKEKKIRGNNRQLKKLEKLAAKVESAAELFAPLSDRQMRDYTQLLRQRLADGETTLDLLPEAFALVREAAARVLGMRHFHVQLLGGVALYLGKIAEMYTGEGKTLVATLPAYLWALEGKGVHIVTVNEYLATRDSQWMGQVYRYLGLSVGVITSDQTPDQKRAAYACDITYGVGSEFGFDYLRDNMVTALSQQVQRGLHYALIDEVDSVLIDDSRSPLIISGQTSRNNTAYERAVRFVRNLSACSPEYTRAALDNSFLHGSEVPDGDFVIDEENQSVLLTDLGMQKAIEEYGEETIDTDEDILNILNKALIAVYLKKPDVDYVVQDGEVIIVDSFTGRMMYGRRYSDGLHEAIEAKEGLRVQNETKTFATITYQNYFRLYAKFAGMTGTAKTVEEEFGTIYGKRVVCIPTNLPVRRVDEPDRLFKTVKAKEKAVIDEIVWCHQTGQPVLVGTISVESSEQLSQALRLRHIPHNVLNAKNHEKEADIIAQAGKKGMVTIATNMAGRGTDILLGGNPDYTVCEELRAAGYSNAVIAMAKGYAPIEGEGAELVDEVRQKYRTSYTKARQGTDEQKLEVLALGGLRIVGTQRHESQRIDNQLRGRSGRQGDVGSSVFFVSLQDDLVRLHADDPIRLMPELAELPDELTGNRRAQKGVERAQQRVESRNYNSRKHVLDYDNVVTQQREVIYGERAKILAQGDIHDSIVAMVGAYAAQKVAQTVTYNVEYRDWDYPRINADLETKYHLFPVGSNVVDLSLAAEQSVRYIAERVAQVAQQAYNYKVLQFNRALAALPADAAALPDGSPLNNFGDVERYWMLRMLDDGWIGHVDYMDKLQRGIDLRAIGQYDPLIAYQKEGYEAFCAMHQKVENNVAAFLLRVPAEIGVPAPSMQLRSYPAELVRGVSGQAVRKVNKIGRNDPCPCGSGKKYKQCHGKIQF